MPYKVEEIKKGIKVHYIKTNKFKTSIYAIFLSTPLNRNTITQNALIPAVLRRGSANLKTQEDISIALENMYGANLDGGVDKSGDNYLIKFYLETLNDRFLPQKEELSKEALELIFDVVFNPLIEGNRFKKEYIDSEKKTVKRMIEGKIDNKDTYAYTRCIEEMYKNLPFGLYKYGYIEDLDKIDETNLLENYKKIINEAKIDIFVSGDFDDERIINIIKENPNVTKLRPREDTHIVNTEETEIKDKKDVDVVQESMDITQGKLVLGLDIDCRDKSLKYAARLYNVILGGSATSKMFQNVREKASLAYTVRSEYVRKKNNIFIRAGIEIANYDKALKIIEKQIDDMRMGNFTDEELENAKKHMVAAIKTIQDEQDSEITYYIGQELEDEVVDFDKYIENINNVTREQILSIADKININTIYFLKN